MTIIRRGENVDCIINLLLNKTFIAIEGHTQSGKTTAGIKVSKDLNMYLFDTDSYSISSDKQNDPLPDYHENFNF